MNASNMKPHLLLLLTLPASVAFADPRTSANYSISADTLDHGGLRATSANYAHDGSVARVAGGSSVAAPLETAKHGYLGQLYEIAGLIVNSAQLSVDEGAALQLAAWQLLDDATFLATDANAVAWSIVNGPIASISANGIATAGLVFQDTPATVEGAFSGFTGSLNLTVLDTIPDNFGAYAGDGIGDDWQVQYFGQDNPLAAPALDPDGDGQSNQFEFLAGMTPTDPASIFRLRIAPVPGQPLQRRIIFNPRLDGRTYVVQMRARLSDAWETLGASSTADNGGERTVTDLNATSATRFYRVEITKP
jgi:hypothetical protein